MGETKNDYLKRYKKMCDSDDEHPEVVVDLLAEAKASEDKAASAVKKGESEAASAEKKGEDVVKKGEKDAKTGEKDADTDLEGGARESTYLPPDLYIQFEGGDDEAKEAESAVGKDQIFKAGEHEKTPQELAKEKEKYEAYLKKQEKLKVLKYVPKFLIGSYGEPGGIECMIDHEYRESTFMCLALVFFNVLSGITTLLIYLQMIFKQADAGKNSLTATQMGGALAFALSSGAAASTKLIAILDRRQIFCLSHFMIGIFLIGAAICTHCESGVGAFVFIWLSQFWV